MLHTVTRMLCFSRGDTLLHNMTFKIAQGNLRASGGILYKGGLEHTGHIIYIL